MITYNYPIYISVTQFNSKMILSTYQFSASFNRLEIWLLKFWPLEVKVKSSIVNFLTSVDFTFV